MFRAFADRTRLRLLNLLRGGEICVCDLVAVLGIPQQTVSRHLGYLRKSGLVLARKDGLWVHYRLAPAAGEFHKSLINCLGCCFNCVPELKQDAIKLARRLPDRKSCSTGCCG